VSWRKERVGENVLEGEIMQCNAGKQSITHSKGNSSIPLEYKKTRILISEILILNCEYFLLNLKILLHFIEF
jgi:hypothetical protein